MVIVAITMLIQQSENRKINVYYIEQFDFLCSKSLEPRQLGRLIASAEK